MPRRDPRSIAFPIAPATNAPLTLTPMSAAIALAILAVGNAAAAPTGGQVVGGAATIRQPNAQTTLVTQTTPRAALNWTGFSIGANESVIFRQPSASAVALNRVVGSDPSMIYGSLQANGQIFLVNPAGVTFARGASVAVGGLVASTLNISNQDFMAGRYVFSGGAGSGRVVNDGTIRAADGGYVAFLGNQVVNSGTIVAKAGSVALGAGDTMLLDFAGDGLLNLKVNTAAAGARIDHGGMIQADGGHVLLSVRAKTALASTAMNVDGIITARGLVERNGRIYLDGGGSGVTQVSGTLDASSTVAGQKGGELRVLGEYVGLFGNATLDASGMAGGGTVLVGGDFQGKNRDIQNAFRTYIGPNAAIKADAIAIGDGGRVIVWSDDVTRFYGNISARGGAEGGNGGFVEASGKRVLGFRGLVDTRAPRGETGALWLDPTNIFIATNQANATAAGMSGTDASADTGAGTAPTVFAASGVATDSLLTVSSLETALGASRVIVTTDNATGAGAGNITVVDPINGPAAPANGRSLTLRADNNIVLGADISFAANGNDIFLVALGGSIMRQPGVTITLGGGGLLLNASTGIGTLANPILTNNLNSFAARTATGGMFVRNSASGNIDVTQIANADIPLTITGLRTTSSGNIVIENQSGSISNQQAIAAAAGGNISLIAAGTITQTGVNGVIDTTGTLTTSSVDGTTLNGANTVGSFNATNTTSGDVNLANANGVSVSGSNSGGGAFNVTVGGGNLLTVNTGNINANTGSVTLRADEMALTGTVTGNAGVMLRPNTAGTAITLGAGTVGLDLSNAALQQVFTTGVLTIGSDSAPAAGSITLGGPIAGGANWSTLSLRTGASIVDGNGAAGADIAVTNLALRAATGIASAADPLETAVTNVAFSNTGAGGVTISNTGALTIANVDGLATSGGGSGATTITAGSPLTIATDVIQLGSITLTASENGAPGPGDDVTVNTGVTVRSTAADVALRAGDQLTLAGTALVESTAVGGSVTLRSGFNDIDGLATDAINGTGMVRADNVGLDSRGGIGSSSTRFNTAAGTLAARSTPSGGVFLNEADAVTLNTVAGISNRAAVGEAYDIVAGGTITVSGQVNFAGGSGPTTLTTTSGNVTVNAFMGDIAAATVITSAGNITGISQILGANLTLDSATGVGVNAGSRMGTFAGTLAARSRTSGGVFVSEGNLVTLDTIGAVPNTTAGSAPYDVTAGGSITLAGDISNGSGIVALAAIGFDIIGGAGRITTTGAVTLSGTRVGTAAAPVLLNLGNAGAVSATTIVAGTPGEIALSDSAAGGLLTSRVTVATDGAPAEQITITQTGAVGITVDANIGNAVDNIRLVASAGKITEGAGTVTGASVVLDSATGVGTSPGARVNTAAGTLAARTTASGGVFINEANALTLDTIGGVGNGTAGGGRFDISAAGALTISGPINTTPAGTNTAGGAVFLTSSGAITSTGTGTITTMGSASAAGGADTAGAGGEVLLHSTGAGAITLNAGIIANGGASVEAGDTGGAGGVVTVRADSGNILAHNITTDGGAPTIQLRTGAAGNTIGQQAGSALLARGGVPGTTDGHLKVDSRGTVTLTNAGNDVGVGTLAAIVRDAGAGFSYTDTNSVGIGTVAVAGTGAAAMGSLSGITTNGGAVTIDAAGISSTAAGTITTTGALDSGAASGAVVLGASGTGAINLLGDIVTTGANNSAGAGSAAGGVTLTTANGAIALANVSAIGGAAMVGNNNGGAGGVIAVTAGGGNSITLNGNLRSGGGNASGSGTGGAGQAIAFGPVLLGANVIVSANGGTGAAGGAGGDIGFAGTVNGAFSLNANTNGVTTFSGAVGVPTPLALLTTDATGTTVINGGAVTTTGAQTYNDPVTIGANTTFTSTGGGDISFAALGASGAFGANVSTSGTTGFGGVVNGGGTPLSSIMTDALGATIMLGGTITTSGAQTYNDRVTLGSNTTLTSTGGGDITFGDTVNGPFSLAANTAGATIFGNAVGGTQALASVMTDAAGVTRLNGGTVTTTGSQTYNDPVTLGAHTTLTSSGAGAAGNITFASTVMSLLPSNPRSLTVNTAGTTTFGGAVGNHTLLTQLLNLTTDAPGQTAINGGSVATMEAQTYNDPVTLGADTGMSLAGIPTPLATITFGSTVQSAGAPRTLLVSAPGNRTFGGAVGGGGNPLASLTSCCNIGITALNGGSVTTTGTQLYDSPVRMGADTILTSTGAGAAGNITFSSTLESPGTPRALTVNTAGTLTFGNFVGGSGNPLASIVSDAPGTTSANGDVMTTGTQTYNDPVVLGQTTSFQSSGGGAAGDITFANTVQSPGTPRSLFVSTAGTTRFLGAVGGGGNPFSALMTDQPGATVISGGAVTTTGSQTYSDPLTLGADTTFTSTAGGSLFFGGTVDGPFALNANAAGFTTFAGALGVGGTAPLTVIATDAAGFTSINTSVRTTGAQTYNDPVTLGSAAGPLTSTGGGGLTFASTLGGPGGLVAVTAGVTTFAGTVGAGGSPLASVVTDAAGSTAINGGAVTTTGQQDYGDPITLGANATLTSGSGMRFNGTLNGPFALNVNTAAVSIFGAAVGDTAPLASLTTDGPGSTIVFGPAITTTGAQTFNDPVTFADNTTLTSTGGAALTFASTVDGSSALAANTAGVTTFAGAVGATDLLASLTTDAAGSTAVNGGSVRTSGAQTYNDPVTLGANTTLTSTGGGAITFASTVNGPFALAVNTAGATTFGGAVGGLTAPASVTTDAAGTTAVNGGVVMTTGAQTYNDAVTLVANATFSAGAGDITFANSVNGPFALTANSTGTTAFLGVVGGVTRLTSLTTNAGGRTEIGGGYVGTSGPQTYNDPVLLTAHTTLDVFAAANITFADTLNGTFALDLNTDGTSTFGGAVGGVAPLRSLITDGNGTTAINGGSFTTTGTQGYNDAVTLGAAATTMTSTGGGNLRFAETLNGASDLTVNTDGRITFGGMVGGTTPLASLTTGPGGATQIDTGITTTGAQMYNNAVTAFGNITLTSTGGGNINFAAALDAVSTFPGQSLAVNTAGTTTFGGVVGGTEALLALTTDAPGTTAINGGAVMTALAQTYNDPVTLGANATLASTGGAALTFAGTLNGPGALIANTTGATTFGGVVGGGIPLASLTTDAPGTTAVNGGAVTTAGAQSYNDPVTLGANTTFTSTGAGNIVFSGTLQSPTTPRALTVNTAGTTTFGAPVGGGGNALASVATDAPGMTAINGGTVTTTGAQTYNDPVTLGADTTVVSTAGGALTFANTVNGPFALTANTAGATTFGGAIGAMAPLTSLTTDAPGTTALNGGAVTTTGNQAFRDPVTLGANNTLTSTSANIAFSGPVNADAAANNRTLAVNAPAGTVTFSGNVGTTQPLADLDVTAGPNTIVFNAAAAQTVNVTGQGGNEVTFNAPVVLVQNLTVTTDGTGGADNSVTFAGPVNADAFANNRTLTVTSGVGTAAFGPIGNTQELGALTVAAGHTVINGNVNTTGGVDFSNVANLTFAPGITIDTDRAGGTGAAGNVLFGATTRANPAAANANLTIDAAADGGAAAGRVELGTIGDVARLNVVSIAGDRVVFHGTVNANQVVVTANSIETPTGRIIAAREFTGTAESTAALTFRGLSTPGIFGTTNDPIRIDAPGLFVVVPNEPNTLPFVFLAGDPSRRPVYEFAGNLAHRFVFYNGTLPESPADRSARGAIFQTLRTLLDEISTAGFAKENIRRQLLQGIVLETGLARPGIDEFTGEGVTPVPSCEPNPAKPLVC